MNNKSLEEFAASVHHTFSALHERGPVALPCPGSQPWNDETFKPFFAAEGPRHIVPAWCFQAYPIYDCINDKMHFQGMRVCVYVSDATMSGKSDRVNVHSPNDLRLAIDRLDAFRKQALVTCDHRNHRHVRNLGHCYNEYQCNTCGHVFQIDSSD